MVEVVLASGSRFRRDMLAAAGIKFRVEVEPVDEPGLRAKWRAEGLDAGSIATGLARAKAIAVSARLPGALVIGADQVLEHRGEIHGKPQTIEEGRAQLARLRDATHSLPTAVALVRGGGVLWSHLERPRLTMRTFSDAFLDRYVAEEGDSLLETAGAYKIEGRGAQLFDRIEGDYFSIIGMPLLPLLAQLRAHGVLKS
jgi:septum formation protein